MSREPFLERPGRRRPLTVRLGRRAQYTHWTTVKTTSYDNADVSTQQPESSRTGVQHIDVDAERAGQRLDNFLMRVLENVPRSRIYRLVRRGEVRVNGRRASPDQRLNESDRIRVPPVRLEPQSTSPRLPSTLIDLVTRAIIREDERVL